MIIFIKVPRFLRKVIKANIYIKYCYKYYMNKTEKTEPLVDSTEDKQCLCINKCKGYKHTLVNIDLLHTELFSIRQTVCNITDELLAEESPQLIQSRLGSLERTLDKMVSHYV